eukprot:TRINITY_DN2106_c0_g3_i1.p1 TRINITY_DN2106_c0_g3~~TRINITY_DN2106_c0_g3_i1.p1  ORF type:complete len:134 (+),score=21.36 TRINITY_DN2106_c0_g3_i1:509-910(+)
MGRSYAEYISKKGKKCYYLDASLIKTMNQIKNEIKYEIGRDLQEKKSKQKNILELIKDQDSCFVIDETQEIYNDKIFGEFWRYIKGFVAQYSFNRISKLKFLFLSNYVSIQKDPVTLEKTINVTPLSLRIQKL